MDASPLSLKNLEIRFPRAGQTDLVIIDGFDLQLDPGVMHCMAGRSGSGKTSVLRVAAGLARPTSGSVTWGDQDLASLSDDAVTDLRRHHVGYLDQGGVLIGGLSAIENVLLPAVPGRQSKAFAQKGVGLLDRLGVGERSRSRPEQLSGGERQRVALARALLLEPQVLVIDEPTASLDRANADSVIELLRSIADAGTAVLVSAHDERLIAAADSRTQMS
jgi:ABC-type lipoprotein export system ATPase subunit